VRDFIEMAIIFILFFLLFLFFGSVHFSSTGEGRHTGYVTAIEQEGYVFPNYRVYVKTDNSSSQEDVYCMHRDKKALVEKIKEYSRKRQLVSVSFNGVRGFGWGLCSYIEILDVSPDVK
jgi:hypothetical protein